MYKLLIACLMATCLHAASPLIVGTNAEFPPFAYIENKTIIGFDIEVAKEVAKHLGNEVQFKDMPFDALIPDLVLGHVDFVAAGMSYTEERAQRVSFTKSYLSEDPFVIFSKGQKMSLEDLSGKTVVVIEGFTSDLFMSSKKDVNLIRLPTQADGFMAIKSGRADAFVTAKSTVNSFTEKQDASAFYIQEIENTGESCALAVPKNKPQMLADVQNALDEMEKDGTMQQLKTKWKL